MSGVDREREVKMMSTPDAWPRWPVLPLKRAGYPTEDRPVTGILFAVHGRMTEVFFGNLHQLKGPTIADAMSCCNGSKVYTDLDAILDDGWQVD